VPIVTPAEPPNLLAQEILQLADDAFLIHSSIPHEGASRKSRSSCRHNRSQAGIDGSFPAGLNWGPGPRGGTLSGSFQISIVRGAASPTIAQRVCPHGTIS
jgi:hypothetical protein